ncbi:MAG: hypothetical protein ACJATV_000566 [Granulosicoccus sp.]|jgi:hypothetical protein
MSIRLVAAKHLRDQLLEGKHLLPTDISSRYGFDSGRLIDDIRHTLFVPIPNAKKTTGIYRMEKTEIERYHSDRKAQISECKQRWYQQEYGKTKRKLVKIGNRKGGKSRLMTLINDAINTVEKKPPSD